MCSMHCSRSGIRTKKARPPCAVLRRECRWPKAYARRSKLSLGRRKSCHMGITNQLEISMISKGWIAAALGALAMASSGGALAQQKQSDTGWYAGGSLGSADLGPDSDT